jgi:FAD/FMN-containing dehydrogenase
MKLSTPYSMANRSAHTASAGGKRQLDRDARFARLSAEHIEYFRSALGLSDVLDGTTPERSSELAGFNEDWMGRYRGSSQLVLRPRDTFQVSQILAYCNANNLAVVPQGGNTGLVGGSVPVFDEIIVSLSNMKRIRDFNQVSGVLTVDAGVILETADSYLAERQHIFPLDLGAKGSCHIGGNVSTNAGGLRLLRYGSLHGNVLGIEAVLPNGTILNDLSGLRKNNTGYNLKHLFIGGEGTIGVVTGVSLICPPKPKAVNVAFFGLPTYEHVQTAFQVAKLRLGEVLSAFEMMDNHSQDYVHKASQNRRPLDTQHAFYCLVETSGSNANHDYEKLEGFLEHVMSEGIVSDGVVAQDASQIKALWDWREGIAEALSKTGGTYKYDLSIPHEHLYQVVKDTEAELAAHHLLGSTDDFPVERGLGYGHMGDMNIHLNVVVRRYSDAVQKCLEPWIYAWTQQHNGSISAEHGLGLAKKPYVGYSRDAVMLDVMAQIKKLFDPKGIMNPYKFI